MYNMYIQYLDWIGLGWIVSLRPIFLIAFPLFIPVGRFDRAPNLLENDRDATFKKKIPDEDVVLKKISLQE